MPAVIHVSFFNYKVAYILVIQLYISWNNSEHNYVLTEEYETGNVFVPVCGCRKVRGCSIGNCNLKKFISKGHY